MQEEEAARLAEEEDARKKEEAERRKVEKAARRAELKKAGLLLTGKAKKEAERLAAMREQLLKSAGLESAGEFPPTFLFIMLQAQGHAAILGSHRKAPSFLGGTSWKR